MSKFSFCCALAGRTLSKKDNTIEMLIVKLPTEQTMTTPGLELVASSRPDFIHNLAIGTNTSDLSHMTYII
jgi:hypothetical protein